MSARVRLRSTLACALVALGATTITTTATELATTAPAHATVHITLGPGVTPPQPQKLSFLKRRGQLHLHWRPGVKSYPFRYDVWVFNAADDSVYAKWTGITDTTVAFGVPSGMTVRAVVIANDAWGQQSAVAVTIYTAR